MKFMTKIWRNKTNRNPVVVFKEFRELKTIPE